VDTGDKVPIKFTQPSLPYNTGDVAWLAPALANFYIEQCVAERARPPYELVPFLAPARVPVEFILPVLPYLPNDVVWFAQAVAEGFIRRGVARSAKPPYERAPAKVAAPKMEPVKFVRPNRPYGAGEVAWFAEVEAASLVRQKFAERVRDLPPYVPFHKKGAIAS
jgi:hypothetical protein